MFVVLDFELPATHPPLFKSPAVNTPAMSDLLPWTWQVAPVNSSATQCPSSARILGTFAAVNAVCTVLSLFFGHSGIVRKLTCGIFGQTDGKPWLYMWIVSLGLQLGANAVIARLMQDASDYLTTFTIPQLVLFYTARPRLSWIVLGFLASVKQKHDYPWRSAWLSNMISELVQQAIALYVMGVTVHYGVTHGYYVFATFNSLPESGRLLYGGAIYYLVATSVYLLCTSVLLGKIAGKENDEVEEKKMSGILYNISLLIQMILVTTWLASWLFWAGFVQTSGER